MATAPLKTTFNDEGLMNKITKISNLGINDKDMDTIRSILNLTPSLRNKFTAIENNLYAEANLLFINADNEESIKLWQELIVNNPSITSIMVTAKKTLPYNELAISHPIHLQSVVNILKSVIQLEKHSPDLLGDINQIKKRVLVVDDSLAVRKYMEEKLPDLQVKYAMNMDFAESGKEAMEKIITFGFDIIFLDVVMPGVDGYKICKWIKKVRPSTPVIMLTSKKSPFDKVRGSMSGCSAYITKPPVDEDLKNAIDKFI